MAPKGRQVLMTPRKQGSGNSSGDQSTHFLSKLGEKGDAYELQEHEQPEMLKRSKVNAAAKSSLGSDLLDLFGGRRVVLKGGQSALASRQDAIEDTMLKLFDEIEDLDERHRQAELSKRKPSSGPPTHSKYISSFADVGAFPIRLQDPADRGERYPKKPEPPHVDSEGNILGFMHILTEVRGLSILYRLWPHALLMIVCNLAAYGICDKADKRGRLEDVSLPNDLHDAYALMG